MFFALLRAGLWEREVALLPYVQGGAPTGQKPPAPAEPHTPAGQADSPEQPGSLDTGAVYRIADEQAVVGLVAAGFDHVEDRTMSKAEVLSFLKKAVSLEGRNRSMNEFVASLMRRLEAEGIRALLVKGQGIGQCYERPLWRSAGDVDLLLDAENYARAKAFLPTIATKVEKEEASKKHFAMHFGNWEVELHGTLHNVFSQRSNDLFDGILDEMFRRESFRIWDNNGTDIPLPPADEDVIIIFSHIIQHFFSGGIGLRQLCDWCRLLHTFRDSLDRDLLKDRISAMGLMAEWKAFAAYAVDYLGITPDDMPMYDPSRRWSRKARRINRYILYKGNFGHNIDRSYYHKYPFLIRKAISLRINTQEFIAHLPIFPADATRIFFHRLIYGFSVAAHGE